MSNETPLIILLEKMDGFLQAMNPIKINLQEKKIAKFYEIMGGLGKQIFKADQIISPEYIMTLLAPYATKVFMKIIEIKDLPFKIKGVIHTQSEINYYKPLYYGNYDLISRMEGLQKKRGKMGEYLVFTFRMSLFNEKEEEVANDIHQFFLRIGEEVN
jgi:hypothetical protein